MITLQADYVYNAGLCMCALHNTVNSCSSYTQYKQVLRNTTANPNRCLKLSLCNPTVNKVHEQITPV